MIDIKVLFIPALLLSVLSGCAARNPAGQPVLSQSKPLDDRSSKVVPLPGVLINPMADVPGDKPLPALQGAIERIDCMSGKEDLHARIAFEARGGRIAGFAYYSKWKPRTCAFDFSRTTPGTKWRLTPDGATRVHTPQGRVLIRSSTEEYVFEFEQVQRTKYCGMPGSINGSMTIKRGAGRPECSFAGIMDANDEYLENLRQAK